MTSQPGNASVIQGDTVGTPGNGLGCLPLRSISWPDTSTSIRTTRSRERLAEWPMCCELTGCSPTQFALGCQLDNRSGLERIREIRQLDNRITSRWSARFHSAGPVRPLDNVVFRAVKASTPGQYTFIVPATREVPRRMLHPRRRTVGVRIPDHVVAQAIVAGLGEPLVSTTLIMPGTIGR